MKNRLSQREKTTGQKHIHYRIIGLDNVYIEF